MSRHEPSAVILAAGKSTRMGRSKPLLPLGNGTVVARVVGLFRSAGAADVRVVLGHHGERLAPVVRQAGGRPVSNPGYEGGMFTSVLAGIGALDPGCPGFFMLPVDIPLVRPHTIRRLQDAFRSLPPSDADRAILHPTFQGRRGHPPLIGGGHIPDILGWEGDGGLRAYLAKWPATAMEVPVADRFILADMDTPGDYGQMAEYWHRYAIPSPGECRALMVDVMAVPSPVWGHCRAVADVAVALARAVNQAGGVDAPDDPLPLDLIQAAALVHDLARTGPDHARIGAAILREMGFPAVADIVAVHMELPPGREGRLAAAEIVYLADKLVAGAARVFLDERFRRQASRFRGRPEALAALARRRARAEAVRDEVERRAGRSIPSILGE